MRRLCSALPARLGLRLHCYLDVAQGVVEPDILSLPSVMTQRRVALDVGANNGVTACVFARSFRNVHAFEANPRLASSVRPALPSHVTLHAVALSDAAGEAELRIPVDGRVVLEGWASLGTPQVGDDSSWRRVRVETRALDSYGFEEVDLIKIDVEGHELSVLAGAVETIRRCRPWFIIEVWDDSRPEVTAFMKELDYTIVPLQGLCGVPGAFNNLIFLPTQSDKAREHPRY